MSQRMYASVATPAAKANETTFASYSNTFTLPPQITTHARTSLVRLPEFDKKVSVRWWCIAARSDGEEASEEHFDQVAERLMRRDMRDHHDCDSADGISLHGRLLWCMQSTKRRAGQDASRRNSNAVWLFRIESSSFASGSNPTPSLVKEINSMLQHCNVQHLNGTLNISQIYGNDAQLTLLPEKPERRTLRHLFKALQEFFIAKWIWQREDNGTREAPSEMGKLQSDVSLKQEDDEEGALGDDGKSTHQHLHDDATRQYWPSHSGSDRRVKAIRYGDGVVLANLQNDGEPHPGRGASSAILRMDLRCFADQYGHVFLETWATDPHLSILRPTSELASTQTVRLAPNSTHARVVRRVGPLLVHRLDMESPNENSAKVAFDKFAEMLQVRGVEMQALRDDWLLCEVGGQHCLWPAQLSFVGENDRRPFINIETPPIATSTVMDLTLNARKLVRDVIYPHLAGQKIDEDDDIVSSVADDDDIDEEEEDAGMKEVSAPRSTKADQVLDVKATASGDETARTSLQVPMASRRASSSADDQAAAAAAAATTTSSRDEDMDLWGPFGFGDQDERTIEQSSRGRDGFDDTGFGGLVTEDDFSFFDDAAAAFSGFDDTNAMDDDVDMDDDVTITAAPPMEDLSTSNAQLAPSTLAVMHSNESDTASVVTSTALADPPSVPGFTPGSWSASSPAVGGMSVKTPRTPYSPNQDLADASVAIEGEHGVLESGQMCHGMHSHYSGVQSHDGSAHGHFDGTADSAYARAQSSKERNEQWLARRRGDISSKYEQGKFAIPLLPAHLSKRNEVETSESGDKPAAIRHRLTTRSVLQESRRHSAGKRSGIHTSWLLSKGRLGALRAEDETSEVTGDGTMSERSSLAGEDSEDDNESINSDNSTEMTEEVMKERQSQLLVSTDLLHKKEVRERATSRPPTNVNAFKQVADEEYWDDLVGQLVDSPHLRMQLCKASGTMEVKSALSQTRARRLFVPMIGFQSQCSLASTWGLPAKFAKEAISADATTARKPATGSTLLHILETPQVLVSCQQSVVSIAPSALPFWDKLGLTAVGGSKHATAFAMHIGDISEAMQREIKVWLTAMERTFASTGLGSHVAASQGLLGVGSMRTNKGMARFLSTIASDAEQWSDTLESLFTRLIDPLRAERHVIIYIIGMPTEMAKPPVWTYARLEGDLRRMAVSRLGVAAELIVVRPCAWHHVSRSRNLNPEPINDIRRVAMSVYDAMQVAVGPQYNSEAHLPRFREGACVVRLPAFTVCGARLGGESKSASDFKLDWKRRTINGLAAGMLLHVAYRTGSGVGQMSYVAVIDEHGQGYQATAWRRSSDSLEEELKRIWKVTCDYTLRARTHWSLVLCKDGRMSAFEAQCWSDIVDDDHLRGAAFAKDFTLTCADTERPLTWILPTNSDGLTVDRKTGQDVNSNAKASLSYLDATQVKYVITPQTRLAYPQEDGNDEGRDEEEEEDLLPILPLCSSLTLTVPNGWNGQTNAALMDHATDATAYPAAVPHQLWLHVLHHRSIQHHISTTDSRLELLLGRINGNFHDLELIARERSLLSDAECAAYMPWHLAMIRSLSRIAAAAFVP
jgi:hypothetical protein